MVGWAVGRTEISGRPYSKNTCGANNNCWAAVLLFSQLGFIRWQCHRGTQIRPQTKLDYGI